MFVTRAMEIQDIPACVDILNHIIALGGSTAYDAPFSEQSFTRHYLHTPPVTNVVVTTERLVGFQAAFDVGDGQYSIASFTDRRSPVRGAGKALFEKTLADCRAIGGQAILAKITADNFGGLAFYGKLGFQDFQVLPDDHTRPDGTTVDRVVKQYPL